MNRKELKKEPHISMEKFLRYYLGIESDSVIDLLSNLHHGELKDVYKQLYRINLRSVGFDDISKEDIETGGVLLVSDRSSHLAPYTNPLYTDFDLLMQNPMHVFLKQDNTITYDEYIDTLDEIALDKNIPKRLIKSLSYRRNIERKEEEND